MRQVVQPASGGPVLVVDVPRPAIGPTEVLVQTVASVISPGTERAVTELARSGLVAKARARPDLVRQVLKKVRTDGVLPAARAVTSRLSDHVPLGYSAAGIVLEAGEAVPRIAPGLLVSTGGAGAANHAEFQAVPGLLCAPVPDGIPADDAAFATLASVALHALRLADLGPGAKVAILGMGLVGQLVLRLAQAMGCDVAALDVSEAAVDRAGASGALGLMDTGADTTGAVLEWSRGRGADAVVVAAAGSSSQIIGRTPDLCRDRATVVVVGDVGLHLDRRPFYERELTLRFARSYGPGRYEPSYEEWAVDYPPGLVRWTEGRNLEAVVDLLAAGRLHVADLVTHRFPIEAASDAYRLIEEGTEPYVGLVLDYPTEAAPERPVELKPRRPSIGRPGVGFVGAGAFARTVLVPAFRAEGFGRLVSVASSSGLSARRMAEQAGFERAVSGASAVIEDPDVDVVVIATPHDSHADLVVSALQAGKHVFCEKPLALDEEELDRVEAAWMTGDGILFVGFNRRWSSPVAVVRDHFAPAAGPLVVTYRVSAGPVPRGHWYHDRRHGGRLLGEACHFVDTCAAIVGTEASGVRALSSARNAPILDDDAVVVLRYPDGSLATISYASGGHPSTEKERIEVLGRSRSATIVDFRRVTLDGRAAADKTADKGHRAEVRAFRDAVASGNDVTSSSISSTRTTLRAVAALTTGA